MSLRTRRWFYPVVAVATLIAVPALLVLFAAIITYPTLPNLNALTDYRPKIPLKVYSADGVLIGEFGEEKRRLVKIQNVPDLMKNAILAAEDERFYQHGGIDYVGVVRAALANLVAGGKRQGASTITMQVARNFFLSRKKSYTRKFNEALLAYKIEHNLSKDEILELYMNQIFLGERAYGFATAAQVYFGKTLDQLTVGEAAVLAGLPKGPSVFNPIANPKAAKQRQLYVLGRMHDLHFITDAQYNEAVQAPIVVRHKGQRFAVRADYVSEMVRQAMQERYPTDAYTHGYKVYTTIRSTDQAAAFDALRDDVEDYDERHGYRGPEGYVKIKDNASDSDLEAALQDYDNSDNLVPGIVKSIDAKYIHIYCKGGQILAFAKSKLGSAKKALSKRTPEDQRLRTGAIVRVKQDSKGAWHLSQLPQVEAAFVSADPQSGAIYSLVGGFDFFRNKFNHVTMAWRQPGSSIKPFIYSAALEKGFTPATVVNDAPISLDASQTGGMAWDPRNYEGNYAGLISMRTALMESKNLASIRILRAITPKYAQSYLAKFGFDPAKQPANLTMALGSGSATPMKMLEGYSVFANGGFLVHPYFIQRIEDNDGKVLYQANPVIAGSTADRVIDVRNAYTMVNMMQDVIRHGTGMRAMSLGRQDLAGKTGTTSDFMDGWFCGFQPTVVAIAWMGFDTPHSLGRGEAGSHSALPMWISYMGKVLKGVPEAQYVMPDGMVSAQVNKNGLLDPNGTQTEVFYKENLPASAPVAAASSPSAASQPAETVRDQLF